LPPASGLHSGSRLLPCRSADRFASVTGKGYRPRPIDLGRLRWAGGAVILGTFLFILVLPLSALIWVAATPFIAPMRLSNLKLLTMKNLTAVLDEPSEEIARQSIGAVAAGAAIVHLHARDPRDGRPTNETAVWAAFIDRIRAETDAIINMSASLGSTAEDRLSAVLELRPDLATVIVGSMNYGLFRKVENQVVTDFRRDWEKELYGPSSHEIVTQNSFAKIGRMIDLLVERDIGIEFECYDVGHLTILEHHLSRKPVRRPIIVQFLTGILGGIPSETDHLLHMKRSAERLFGDDVRLFIHGTGRENIRTAARGALLGTHVRVGQEDTEALGDRVMELLLLRLFEGLRPEAARSAELLSSLHRKLRRSLEVMEQDVPSLTGRTFDLGHLTIGVALSYLDFRFPGEGLARRPPRSEALA